MSIEYATENGVIEWVEVIYVVTVSLLVVLTDATE